MAKKGRIVLIIGGGIAAYKSLDLVRELKRGHFAVDCVMTKSATEFIQPLSFAGLSGNKVRGELFDESSEAEMDHIALSRSADLLLVAPATANIIAKMAGGLADDLATTLLLATDTPIMLAPAMNWRMWSHKATRRNVALLKRDGVHIIEPDVGEMACGEFGSGRLPPIKTIADNALTLIDSTAPHEERKQLLKGKAFLITSGATREKIDPVRYISNHSSGKQGFALAEALVALGADVFYVEGCVSHSSPKGARMLKVETAAEMKQACDKILSTHKIDGAFCVAAVCDWRIRSSAQKIKKQVDESDPNFTPNFIWEKNPDILASIAHHAHRPSLVVGFAAETENLIENARLKLKSKACDWIIANDVSQDVFGSDFNQAVIVRANGEQALPKMTKTELARKICQQLPAHFNKRKINAV